MLFVLSCFTTSLKAQYELVGAPIISHFQKSDYHAGSQNWAAIQDERGIMYFGNNKGLLEFDGTTWRTFPLPNATIVRSLALGNDGRLYIGGQDELGYLHADKKGNSYYVSLADKVPETYKSFEDVWKIFPKEEAVFFCTTRAVFILRGEQMEVIPISSRVEKFFECKGDIYLQDPTKGLLLWNGEKFENISQGARFSKDDIAALLPYKNGQTLIISVSKGLFLMDQSGIRSLEVEASGFLNTYDVYCALALSDDRYAIGTSENGLLIMDQSGYPLMHLNQEKGLQNNTILNIHQDKHQNLWLALDNGIDYVESGAPFSLISNEVGVEGTGYASLIHDNRLFLGTNLGLFSIDWPKNSNPFEPGTFRKVQAIKGQLWHLDELEKDLLVSQHDGAVQIKEDQVLPLPGIKGAWKFLKLDHHPSYAIAGSYSGLSLFKRQATNAQSGAGWAFLRKLEGFNESARVMEQDNAGNIWVSHAYKGLYKISLDIESQRIDEVRFYNSKNGLPSDISINVCKIRGELVFTTQKGIYYFDENTDQFKKHIELNKVFGENANIQRLIEDQLGNIWFSLNDEFGVLKITEQGLSNKIDKIYFNQLKEKIMEGFEHVYAHDPQNIFIATENGFIHYNPSSNKDFRLPFKTIIRNVVSIAEKDSVVFGGNAPGKSSSQTIAANIEFPNKLNDFRFSFSTPYYEQIKHIQYRYRLEGFHENWSEWTTQSEKEYTNLRHGDYAFEVEARNAYGQSSASATYSFSITPPWHATLLARTGFVFALIILILSLLRSVSKKAEKEKAVLKQEQAKKLQQKEDEFKQEAEKSEAEIIKLRNENLEAELNHKNSQLTAAAMHLVQKEEMIRKIKQELDKLMPNVIPENKRQIKLLVRNIIEDIQLDDNWEQFEFHFDKLHENFLKNLRKKYPVLTPKDQKLCAYLRMNLSTKEIAPLMNISVRGVEISRYRLRKKLELDSDTNLVEFLINL